MKNLLKSVCLLAILLLLNACSEPTSNENIRTTKEKLALSTIMRGLGSAINDPIKLEEQMLGFMASISLSYMDDSASIFFDYTGLGLNDDYRNKVVLNVYYFEDTASDVYHSKNYIFDSEFDNSYEWSLQSSVNPADTVIKDIRYNIFKQTAFPPSYSSFEKTKRVAILLEYYPEGTNKKDNTSYVYCYKGVNAGNGAVELVGRTITMNGSVISVEGDMEPLLPYTPTY